MAIRNIVKKGDDILRKKCREVSEVTDRIRLILEDMVDTMHSELGVGLAAPQVGIMRRMFVAEPVPESGNIYYMINPEIYEREGSQVGEEGCLSVPELFGDVERYDKIEVHGINRNNKKIKIKAEGFLARIFQHEIDHLNGILFVEKLVNPNEIFIHKKEQ